MNEAFYKLDEGSSGQVYLNWDLYLRAPRDFQPPQHWFMETSAIEAEYTPLTLKCGRATNAFPDFVAYGQLNFVSDRLRNLAQQVGKVNAEFLPVTALSKNGKSVSLNPYWCVHFLETPTCIDESRSDVEFWSSRTKLVKTIRRLVLDATAVAEDALFMPLGLGMVFVSGSLADRMRSANLRVGLTPIGQIRLGAAAYGARPRSTH